ncbi:MAG: hypothetical protein WBG85_04795 [Rhodanobacter sp.]
MMPVVVLFFAPLVQACDSADVDPVTGVCAHPFWTQQQLFFPDLDMPSGVAIGTAILACWAVAYVYKSLRRVGD